MSLGADLDRSALTVLLDVRNPFCFLALGPAMAFGESMGIEIDWLPLAVPPLRPPSAPGRDDRKEAEGPTRSEPQASQAREDRGVLHRRHRARALAREIDTYAAAQGLVLKDPYRDGDAEAAQLGWLWVRDRQRARLAPYLTELFRRYWALELDASSLEAVAALVEQVAGDGGAFRDWSLDQGPAAAEALAGELRERGLFGVPGYVVEDEVFVGRQHLPMIRWILEGRSGPVPI